MRTLMTAWCILVLGLSSIDAQSQRIPKTLTTSLVCYGPAGDSLVFDPYMADSFDVTGRRIQMIKYRHMTEDVRMNVTPVYTLFSENPDSNWSYWYFAYKALPDMGELVVWKSEWIYTERCSQPVASSPRRFQPDYGRIDSILVWEDLKLAKRTTYILDTTCKVIKEKTEHWTRWGSNHSISFHYFLDKEGRTIKCIQYKNDSIPTGDTTLWSYSLKGRMVTYLTNSKTMHFVYYNTMDTIVAESSYERPNKSNGFTRTKKDSTAYEYSPGGKLIRRSDWSRKADGSLYLNWITYHDWKKGISETINYDEAGGRKIRELRRYDSAGRVVEITDYKKEALWERTVYFYESDGRSHHKFIYDSKGKLLEHYHLVYTYYD